MTTREPLLVSALIEEAARAATLDATAKGVSLVVTSPKEEVFVNAGRDVLTAAVTNLLQNAVTFSEAGTTVTVSVGVEKERVLIEVEDACGGFPYGEISDVFRSFTQRSADRSGLELSLAFARWAAEANEGQLVSHNLPGKGCIFTLNLPRVPVPATSST
jgi:signal transduction histidine kinase